MQATYADDTEVFFPPGTSGTTPKPNVMFIMDTSGSMLSDTDYDKEYDDFPNSRLQIVKDVLTELLTDVKDINAGLMRFMPRGHQGGSVLLPIVDLDKPVDVPYIFGETKAGSDDGKENSSGSVTVNSRTLTLNEERNSVRFSDLNIPNGVKIKSARISFVAKQDTGDTPKFHIKAQMGDAGAIQTINNNISSRLYTSNHVEWQISSWYSQMSYSTPDLKDIVQQVVSSPSWCGGQSLLFTLKRPSGSGEVKAYSYEGFVRYVKDLDGGYPRTNILAPQLRIEYEKARSGGNGCFYKETTSKIKIAEHDLEEDTSTINFLDFYTRSGGGNNQRFALGFNDVDVPPNKQILDAKISLVAAETSAFSGETNISAVNNVDPDIDATAFAASKTSSVNWSGMSFTKDSSYETPQLSGIVQTLVNKSGWLADNPMLFVFDGVSGDQRAYSYEKQKAKSAVLRIKYRDSYSSGDYTHRHLMKHTTNGLIGLGYTPIAGALNEAVRYFQGKKVRFGKERLHRSGRGAEARTSGSSTYTGGVKSIPSACPGERFNDYTCRDEKITGEAKYEAPEVKACQNNYIVYLTDGAPTGFHNGIASDYTSWTGGNIIEDCPGGNCVCTNATNCPVALTKYLFDLELSPTPSEPGGNVITRMIGFTNSASDSLMLDMAEVSGSKVIKADNKVELRSAFEEVLNNIADVTGTFVTAGVTVNQNNRLTHSDKLYYSLFTPTANNAWPGNLKHYKLNDGTIYGVDTAVSAVDPTTGQFRETTKSFWSTAVDGNNVVLGGAASKLPNKRNLYSNLNGSVNLQLKATGNQVRRSGSPTVTKVDLGVTDDTEFKESVDWALGYDIKDATYNMNSITASTPAHKIMSNPLHSQPTIVQYDNGGTAGNIVYVGTNDGMLHAIDTENGEEKWAFIPYELLSNLPDIKNNNLAATDFTYGLDGSITTHIVDANENGVVDGSDKAYLYVGMRRGGSSYYALDITDRTDPKLKFIISAKSTAAELGEGILKHYPKLGQTWSKPIIAKMKFDTTEKQVMIFGGGYDVQQDINGAPLTDNIGNTVYIADALTGDMLWDATDSSNTSLLSLPTGSTAAKLADAPMNSVPADITAIDLDGDNAVDHFYVADTKAQIYRFDVDSTEIDMTRKIKGARIASLQPASATLADNRRFYNSVDAAKINVVGNTFVSLSIGSGFRANPLNVDINDHFYMIKDYSVLSGDPDTRFKMNITLANLADVTDKVGFALIDGKTDAQVDIVNTGNHGWYIRMPEASPGRGNPPGQKILSSSVTYNNTLTFTSYIPSFSPSVCAAALGYSLKYTVHVTDGTPYYSLGEGLAEKDNRYEPIFVGGGGGIAPQPQVIFSELSDGTTQAYVCIGTSCEKIPTPQGIIGYKWHNKQ